ncbi:hypothetical protein N7470_009168 [Penicillium chermesinum]|nr:hypothetical protein N7470_009168 [Penicillium chermesinum]
MGWDRGDQPSRIGVALIGTGVSLAILVLLFAAARFYTRCMQRVKFGLDDWVFLIAVVAIVTRGIFLVVLVEMTGLGYKPAELSHPAHDVSQTRKGLYVLEIFDIPLTITPAKISLLLFYRRIFCTRSFQITASLIGSIILGLGIATLFQTIFQCSPISAVWDTDVYAPEKIEGMCVNQVVFYRVVSPINLATGIMTTLLPIPWVWKLHLQKGQKISVIGVFLLSGL